MYGMKKLKWKAFTTSSRKTQSPFTQNFICKRVFVWMVNIVVSEIHLWRVTLVIFSLDPENTQPEQVS